MPRVHAAVSLVTASVLAVVTFGSVARAQQPVDLELILAVDVSGSMDEVEAKLQRDGYLNALVDPDVVRAISAGYRGAVALTYIEWASVPHKAVIADWTAVRDGKSAAAFVARIAEMPVSRGMYTSISSAIEFALPRFEGNGFTGSRRVIDISGDGANNEGTMVTTARDAAMAAHVVINGLPIVNDRVNPYGRPQTPDLDLYYQSCVIGGPGSFIVVAKGFGAFAEAVRRKLIFEIAGNFPGSGPHFVGPPARKRPRVIPAALTGNLRQRTQSAFGPVVPAARQAPPCDVGERERAERFRMWNDR